MRAVASPLPPVIPRGQAGFPAEELRKMAGIGIAHVQRDFHHAPLRLAQQAARCTVRSGIVPRKMEGNDTTARIDPGVALLVWGHAW